MRFLLLFCIVLAACSPPERESRNPPTVNAPAAFVEAQEPITLENAASLRYLGRLDPPDDSSTVFDAALSPDETRLVGVNNEQMLAWDLLTGELIFQTGRGDVTRVFYSPDKTEIYGVETGGRTGIYDANTGALQSSFNGHAAYNLTAAYFVDQGWLALGGADGTVKVWDTAERRSLVTIEAQDQRVTTLAFSQDGDLLATAGAEGVVRVWRWRDHTLIDEHKLATQGAALLLAFAPDAAAIAIATDHDARLWSPGEAEAVVLETGIGGAGEILRFSPDGRFLLTGNRGAGLSLWGTADSSLTARLPDTLGNRVSAAFSPDSSLLVTTAIDGKTSLWNLVQVSRDSLTQSSLDVGTERVFNVSWTLDSRLILFFDAGGPVYLWGVG